LNYDIFIAMNNLISELKSKLTSVFSQESKIISPYVFGSFVQGSTYPKSDYDSLPRLREFNAEYFSALRENYLK